MSNWKRVGSGLGQYWELRGSKVTVSVHRHIEYGPDRWLASYRGPVLYIDNHPLASTDSDVAKEEALCYLRELVADLQAEVESLWPTTP